MRVPLLAALLATCVGVCLARCDRSPEGNPYPRTSANDRFHIQISGNPDTYVPGEQYTVFLRGTVNAQEQHKFKDFLLIIEPEQQQLAGHAENRGPGPNGQVGHFTLLGDALTKFSDLCNNAVAQTNSLPKTEIQVFWKAPPSGSGCVAFRATVVEQRDMWYMDEGDLSKVLCEEITESDDSQPPVLQKCCACDEAKYEVTFEGLWSRNTHPKDFPSNGWLTRFSDVIGASHTKNYTFWNYGEYASEGLRQVAENGNTRMLESELKGKSDHIRTIIKARGISYPNVTGKTFAVFRVDNQHHLMSLVSMIDPSPDWFVGVSSLELCLRNCSWIESKMLNLYPWDAGTDDGWTYISPDSPSTPRSPIRRIKSNSPNDPRSPFYDATGTEMKPLARLYLSRQRLYEKPCDDVEIELPDQPDDCDVTEWSDWSPCSATCGKGTKYRQRKYVRDSSKYVCTKHLTSRATCYGPQRNCPDRNEDPIDDPRCGVTDWSEWSSCSVTCGKGSRTRDRRYHTRNATKHCPVGGRNSNMLKDTESCEGVFGPCEGDDNEDNNSEVKDCADRPWSDWAPCSVTCGNGFKIRTRDPVNTENDYDEDATNEAEEEESDPCEDERDKEIVECQAEIPTCDISSSSAEATPDSISNYHIGPFIASSHLNEPDTRYDTVVPVIDCKTTKWTKWTNCNATEPCTKGVRKKHRDIVIHPMNGGKYCPKRLIKFRKCKIPCQDNKDDLDPTWGPPGGSEVRIMQDCLMSKWSPWSPCSMSCGAGIQQRTRKILRHPRGGGKPCLSRIENKTCHDFPCPYS